MADSPPIPAAIEGKVLAALTREDPLELARHATEDQLRHLKSAEDLIEQRQNRKRRASRLAAIAQVLVGYVALAGFFANAYQNWANQRQADARARQESDRWNKEFKRAQDSDKYRAFFETSALVTDATNPDRRLVGYALLKEFVDDKDYSSKAIIMLEESLALELRGDTAARGLDDQHHRAVLAILEALSHTSDCTALVQSARSVDKLVPKPLPHAAAPVVTDDSEDNTYEVFSLFVRRLVGRAAQICGSAREFREVRRPIREELQHLPGLGKKTGKLGNAEANHRIAEIIKESCLDEAQASVLSSDCVDVMKGYARICGELGKQPNFAEEDGACQVMKAPTP